MEGAVVKRNLGNLMLTQYHQDGMQPVRFF